MSITFYTILPGFEVEYAVLNSVYFQKRKVLVTCNSMKALFMRFTTIIELFGPLL